MLVIFLCLVLLINITGSYMPSEAKKTSLKSTETTEKCAQMYINANLMDNIEIVLSDNMFLMLSDPTAI